MASSLERGVSVTWVMSPTLCSLLAEIFCPVSHSGRPDTAAVPVHAPLILFLPPLPQLVPTPSYSFFSIFFTNKLLFLPSKGSVQPDIASSSPTWSPAWLTSSGEEQQRQWQQPLQAAEPPSSPPHLFLLPSPLFELSRCKEDAYPAILPNCRQQRRWLRIRPCECAHHSEILCKSP